MCLLGAPVLTRPGLWTRRADDMLAHTPGPDPAGRWGQEGLHPSRPAMNLFELFNQGGPLMWVILAASVVGVFFFFERTYTLQRSRILPRAFVDRIRAMVAKGQTSEALLLCEENGSSIALMMAAALRAYKRHKSRADIKEAVEEVGNREVSHMDKNVEVVGTVASVSPLLGLLGTVVGMIQVFQKFVAAYSSGNATPDVFAQGIWTALITTAFGLMVAIPMLVLYKSLQGRNDRLIVEMEEDAMGLVDLLEEAQRADEDDDFVDRPPGRVRGRRERETERERDDGRSRSRERARRRQDELDEERRRRARPGSIEDVPERAGVEDGPVDDRDDGYDDDYDDDRGRERPAPEPAE